MADCPQKTVRVCFVCPKVYPLFDRACTEVIGGAEVDLYNLGTELANDASFTVSFVTADYRQPPEVVTHGVRLIRSLDFQKGQIPGALAIWRAMKKADADIYLTKTASPGVPLVEAFCRFHKKAFVFRTAHQDDCDGTYIKRHPVVGRAYARALRRARLVLTQNQVDRENLKKLLNVDAVVIPNGHRLPAQAKRSPGSILWVGRSAGFKHPQKFLHLARRMPAERFVMICQRATGDCSYDKLLADAEAVANLTFIERVPFHEIDNYFQAARVLVNTSDSEGFSNTFIQAGRWSVPILSLSVNPDDFLNRWSCGLCCSGDENRLLEGLRFLLAGDKYMEIGQNARKYVEANHDITRIADIYKDLFRKMV